MTLFPGTKKKNFVPSTGIELALPSQVAACNPNCHARRPVALSEKDALTPAGWAGRYKHLTRATTLHAKVNSVIPRYFFFRSPEALGQARAKTIMCRTSLHSSRLQLPQVTGKKKKINRTSVIEGESTTGKYARLKSRLSIRCSRQL